MKFIDGCSQNWKNDKQKTYRMCKNSKGGHDGRKHKSTTKSPYITKLREKENTKKFL